MSAPPTADQHHSVSQGVDGAKVCVANNRINSDFLHSESDIVQIIEIDYHEIGDAEQCDAPLFPHQYLNRISASIIKERADRWPRLSPAAAIMEDLRPYMECLAASTHNVLCPRVPLRTSNNLQAWREIAMDQDDAWLVDCINFGFPMQYRGPPLYNKIAPNHPSAMCHEVHVNKYISSELSLGVLLGPFKEPPFLEWCNVAPIMTREKANNMDRNIIVDLSFPPGNRPNHHIVKNMVFGRVIPHMLPSVNDAVNIITTLNFDVMLSSVDISRAYRNFALDPLDWPLACIHHKGQYYIEPCMPFGSRISSLYMQKMACLLQRALLAVGITTIVYLDDVLIISPRSGDPRQQFEQVIQLLKKVGLPVAWDKVAPAARCVRFLGIIIDLNEKEIRMPREKIDNFLALIKDVCSKKYITKRTLQKVLGHSNHLSKAVPPAHLFINRLLECLGDGSDNMIRVNLRLARNLDWFADFLAEFNGRSLIIDPNPTITIEADSCLTGGGAWMNDQCYSIEYPARVARAMHITQLEAYNCLVAARVFLWEDH